MVPSHTTSVKDGEKATGTLFGNLFAAYDDKRFIESLELLEKRFRANKFPMNWFQGKKCLDVGCGGGRYSMALAKLGAKDVTGIDVSETGIADAKKRAADLGLPNVHFQVGSALELPFEDNTFDGIIFSGVIMATAAPVTALNEVTRVLKPGGMLYLLVYATEGIRWPLIQMLRPIAQSVGFPAMDKAVTDAGLPVNKRRTYLDDLFVPYTDFYSWECLKDLLTDKGLTKIDRWKTGRLDHEENMDAYLLDLEGLDALMSAAAQGAGKKHKAILQHGAKLCSDAVEYVRKMHQLLQSGDLSEADAMEIVIGQGHHRVVCWKS